MRDKNQSPMTNLTDLQSMREVDIRTVDTESLVDIATVRINPDLTQQERVAEYLQQIKNPYCYLCNGMVVKISFAGKRRLEDCLKDAMFQET